MIKFCEGTGDEEIIHLVNPKYIVSVDIFPNEDVKIVLNNGTVYETNSIFFSVYDWIKLHKLNIESREEGAEWE